MLKKLMTSYGEYLLSSERRELFKNHPEPAKGISLDERISNVHHSDFENWKSKQSRLIKFFL